MFNTIILKKGEASTALKGNEKDTTQDTTQSFVFTGFIGTLGN